MAARGAPDWLRRFSFRTRLSTLVAAAVGITVTVAALASYVAVSHQLYQQVDASLVAEARSSTALSPGGQFNPRRVESFLLNTASTELQLVGPHGTVVFKSLAHPLPVSARQAALVSAGLVYRIDTVKSYGVTYRVITEGGLLQTVDGTPVAVQIARPLNDIVHSLADLRLILWIVALAGIALAIALGYVIGRTTIRPVERLTEAAEHVAATQQLDATIDGSGEDELGRLARAFNAMLGALAASRRQQAQLVSDAGHELRTPLTSLRTNVEVLLRAGDLPPADRADLLRDVRSQLEELSTLIGDVVDLARQDEQQPEPVELRLDAVVNRAIERARRRAPGLRFEVRLTPGSVLAQPALLERAVLNVLDNAAKWSPPGGTVEVELARGDRWRLDIRDHGPGIAAEDLPRVFDRFYRAQSARSLPGSGLGLAIVAQVIAAHGGTVTAASPAGGGTLLQLYLPLVDEQEPWAVGAGAGAGGAAGGHERRAPGPGWPPPLPPPTPEVASGPRR